MLAWRPQGRVVPGRWAHATATVGPDTVVSENPEPTFFLEKNQLFIIMQCSTDLAICFYLRHQGEMERFCRSYDVNLTNKLDKNGHCNTHISGGSITQKHTKKILGFGSKLHNAKAQHLAFNYLVLQRHCPRGNPETYSRKQTCLAFIVFFEPNRTQ